MTPSYAGHDAIAAGVILRRSTGAGDRWLLLKAHRHGEWGFPKGHVDPGEGLLSAALRECAEETGIGLLAIEGAPRELLYLLPDQRRKRVVYYPAVTAVSDVQLSSEHSAAAWLSQQAASDHLRHQNLRRLFSAYLATHR